MQTTTDPSHSSVQESTDRCRWTDRLWASFIFFTRLPLWRIHEPPREAYRSVVEWWPLTGWLTGGAMALTLYFGALVLPMTVAVVLALVVRLLLTGALHEDGLADFFDGFGGGGTDRERILTIMKDSHIGTYGVLSLILYIIMVVTTLASLTPTVAALTIVAAAPLARLLTATLLSMPYARREEEAKAKTVYRHMSPAAIGLLVVQGVLPAVLLLWRMGWPWAGWLWTAVLCLLPCLTTAFLHRLIRRRLHGYTGDCCGAVCLMTELSIYLTVILELRL